MPIVSREPFGCSSTRNRWSAARFARTSGWPSGPLRVAGEVTDWQGHAPETLKAMKDHLEELKRLGVEAIED